MASQKLLLPFNFTPNDIKALEFVLQTFKPTKDLEITLFHAYTPVPDIEASGHSVMGKLKANVMKQLVDEGFPETFIRTVFRPRKWDVATEIIDLAQDEHFDFIVLNHKPGRVSRFFTGSVFNKVVMALKNTTVCIVS